MQKIFQIAFLIFLCLNVLGREKPGRSDSIEIKKKRIELGLTFAPNYSYRVQRADQTEVGYDITNDISVRYTYDKRNDIPDFGWQGGVVLRIYRNSNYFSTGINVQEVKYKTKLIDVVDVHFQGSSPLHKSVFQRMRLYYSYDFFNIPFTYNICFGNSKGNTNIDYYLGAGFSVNYFIGGNTKVRSRPGKPNPAARQQNLSIYREDGSDILHRFTDWGIIRSGINIKRGRVTFSFEPAITLAIGHFLYDTNTFPDQNIHPYSFAMHTSILYNLKK